MQELSKEYDVQNTKGKRRILATLHENQELPLTFPFTFWIVVLHFAFSFLHS